MRTVTRYMASDGSEWNQADDALRRDALILIAEDAIKPLKTHPLTSDEGSFRNGNGYIQQDLKVVAQIKMRLWEISREFIGDWMDNQSQVRGIDLSTVHPSWPIRMLDGGAEPVERAWSRLACIDAQGREWGQQYYAGNPPEDDPSRCFEIEGES